MKILVVCQHFYPEQFRINDICYELVKKGHSVTVVTGLPNYPKGKVFKEYRWFRKRKEIINGVEIRRCSLIGRGNSKLKMALNYAWFAIFGSLKVLFMKKDFDIIYVYQLSPISMTWPAILAKKIKKKPLIIHCLDQWPISLTTVGVSRKSIIYKFFNKISINSYRQADLITISSKSFKDYFTNELGITIEEKGLLYWPSYAESNYENLSMSKNKTFDLVFAGNIGPAQSVETIVEAANILKYDKSIKFHIVGDGLTRNKCEKLAKKYNLKNIEFYGFYPVSEMDKFYSLADAFLITMVNNEVVNNTLPAKVQSYMIAAKPIIGAVSGEVKKVIDESNCGLCCESLDYKSLADNILQAKSNKKRLTLWSKNAYKYYKENFSKEKCISDLESMMEKVLKQYKA